MLTAFVEHFDLHVEPRVFRAVVDRFSDEGLRRTVDAVRDWSPRHFSRHLHRECSMHRYVKTLPREIRQRYAPSGVRPRVYTHSDIAADEPEYLALRALGIGIPFYREMKVYLPRLARLCAEARRDGIELIHLTTPGPVGFAALHVAARLRVPLIRMDQEALDA